MPRSFFDRDTRVVARELLGKKIIRHVRGKRIVARIVETEAYLGEGDPASHSSRGPTPRSSVMFGPPGVIYVYFIYGNYHMLNFVTERDGRAGAVLIRGVEPIEGEELMWRLRGMKPGRPANLSAGPGKLTEALGIGMSLNKMELALPHLAVVEGKSVRDVVSAPRIGISGGTELLYRFYEKNNPFVSRK